MNGQGEHAREENLRERIAAERQECITEQEFQLHIRNDIVAQH